MKKKDRENEYIGIASITLIVILSLMLIYYFYSRPSVSNETNATNVPVDAPSPPIDKTK